MAQDQDPQVQDLAQVCLDLFKDLIDDLSQERHSESKSPSQIDEILMLEEYGRLKVWCEENQATLPASSRGSLAYRLRHEDQLRQGICEIFQQMKTFLQLVTQLRTTGPHTVVDPKESKDQEETQDSDSSEGESKPTILVYLDQVYSKIALLYHTNNLLRRIRHGGKSDDAGGPEQ
ncbi:hypothetical protein F4778DRAFT_743355 [Xylariomycetidae sp. FL2044]|nr:hypothetical protein F4778DRAFT_743355 [Xylariomycetidae sp. FL2044]